MLFSGGYLGTGLALGALWGSEMADTINSGSSSQVPCGPAPWDGDFPPFPLPALRVPYFNAARFGFELQDRFRP